MAKVTSVQSEIGISNCMSLRSKDPLKLLQWFTVTSGVERKMII